MIYSVRWQFLLSMVSVILITVGMTAFFANQAATAEIHRLQGQDNSDRTRRLSSLLTEHHLERQTWAGAQDILEMTGELYGQRLVLINQQGRAVADSHLSLLGQQVDPQVRSQGTVALATSQGRLGTLLFNPELPMGDATFPNLIEEPSTPSLRLLLVLSGLLAMGVAMILTFFLSRRIVAPVESLAKVSRQAARRDFSVRAEVKSRDEVGELARTFNSMIEELSRIEELRRQLVADVAHELRTPITNLRGYIEGIEDGIIFPEPATLVSMHDEVFLLTRLIEDLQELALAESGQMQLRLVHCHLDDLVRSAVNATQNQAQAKQVALAMADLPELPVQADPERISQVLRNLLVNAVTHTPSGGSILVQAQRSNGNAQVQVRDTGLGIPAEDLPYIFERFYRADKSRSRATGGCGLGLTISRHLVEAHGGSIEAFSQLGQGTELRVSLPAAKPEPAEESVTLPVA
ncbi:MAG: sensor histidine kinase [Dehalococcoidia bacterium]